MLLSRLDPRLAGPVRAIALALIVWSVVHAHHSPGTSGRGLVVTITLVACVAAWLVWMIRPDTPREPTPEIYVLAAAGGVLAGAAPSSAASAFVFVAAIMAALRVDLGRAFLVVALGVLGLAVTTLIYNGSAVGLLAYTLGFAAGALAASNARQARERADQAELLLAQTQRSHEEQLLTARLEESTKLAREIHDVLAHTLAGLTLQLEATLSLLDQGADRDAIRGRLQRAHGLAREGLTETRRAVGALRGEQINPRAGIEALVADYRTSVDAPAELTVDGDSSRLAGQTGQAVLRVAQEALTNVRKHAPGASVSITVVAGRDPDDDVLLRVDDRPAADRPPPVFTGLADSGGGYGLQGMRERAELLGGTLSAGPLGEGWRVELRLPSPETSALVREGAT